MHAREYRARTCPNLPLPSSFMPTVATHKQPDGDALAALWLAERFLFREQDVKIVFVGRGASASLAMADCVVDVGNEYDTARLRFDHKPPAFTDRNTWCAARLVWEHVRKMGQDVEHLAKWIAVVHEGDSNPPRSPSDALKASRTDGFHAAVAHARRDHTGDDAMIYGAVRAWLDAHEQRLKDLRLT